MYIALMVMLGVLLAVIALCFWQYILIVGIAGLFIWRLGIKIEEGPGAVLSGFLAIAIIIGGTVAVNYYKNKKKLKQKGAR